MLATRPRKLGKYPHFVRDDAAIWERYLSRFGHTFDYFWYDVRVGRGADHPAIWEKKWADAWWNLTAKRIDVVGFRPQEIVIIEVRTNAGVGAIGNLIAYQDLFIADYHPEKAVKLMLITNRYDHDLAAVCAKQGIEYVIV